MRIVWWVVLGMCLLAVAEERGLTVESSAPRSIARSERREVGAIGFGRCGVTAREPAERLAGSLTL